MSLRLSTNAITEITGTYSFTFAFEAHLNESDLVTSLEVSTAETSVPLIIKWFRIKEEKIFPVPEIASKIYITTCEDIGAIIQVEITTEDSSLGTAIGKIGPFRLDRSVRKALELIICKGFGKFPLICSGELDYDNASDLLLEVEKDQLRLQTFSKNGEIDLRNSFTTAYSVTYPKILLNKSDCTKLSFVMNDGNTELSEQDLAYNRKLLVNCLTQQTRDLIVMTIRVFALKNSIKIDRLLEADLEEIGKRHTDAYLELGSIMQEMNVLQDENFLLRDENLNQKKQINSRKSPESIEKLQEKLRKSNESKERLRLKYSQKRIETEELQAIIEGLKESESALSEKLIAAESQIEVLSEAKISLAELPKVKAELEFALQDLEIARAKDKTSNNKLKRQTEAIEALMSDNESLKLQVEISFQKEQNSLLIDSENAELQEELCKLNKKFVEKEQELKENNENFEKMKKNYEGSNEGLMLEIHALNEELQQYKISFEGIDAKKLKDEVLFYRNQCDSLSAQLSRAQAMARRGK